MLGRGSNFSLKQDVGTECAWHCEQCQARGNQREEELGSSTAPEGDVANLISRALAGAFADLV